MLIISETFTTNFGKKNLLEEGSEVPGVGAYLVKRRLNSHCFPPRFKSESGVKPLCQWLWSVFTIWHLILNFNLTLNSWQVFGRFCEAWHRWHGLEMFLALALRDTVRFGFFFSCFSGVDFLLFNFFIYFSLDMQIHNQCVNTSITNKIKSTF